MDLTTARLHITYATRDKLKRIRAASTKHGGSVHVEEYTRGAFEGYVSVPTRWDEGREQHEQRCAAIRKAIQG